MGCFLCSVVLQVQPLHSHCTFTAACSARAHRALEPRTLSPVQLDLLRTAHSSNGERRASLQSSARQGLKMSGDCMQCTMKYQTKSSDSHGCSDWLSVPWVGQLDSQSVTCSLALRFNASRQC